MPLVNEIQLHSQSFGHNGSFRHNINHASDQKDSFTKVVQFGSLSIEMSSEVKIIHSFGHNCSFHHNLNRASDKKQTFYKICSVWFTE
jgi:hypothetical protein